MTPVYVYGYELLDLSRLLVLLQRLLIPRGFES
jgi:hypothetical protein